MRLVFAFLLLVAATSHGQDRIYGQDLLAAQHPSFQPTKILPYLPANVALGTLDYTLVLVLPLLLIYLAAASLASIVCTFSTGLASLIETAEPTTLLKTIPCSPSRLQFLKKIL